MESGQLRDAIVVTTLGLWHGLWAKVVAFIPNLAAALVLLVVGYALARIAQRVGTAVLQRVGLDRVALRVGVSGVLEQSGIRASAAEVVGHLLFWLLMLMFLVSAAETLGLPNVSETIDAFVLYVPRVIAAAVITVVGVTLASFAHDVVRSGAEGLGVEYARALGKLAYGVLLIVTASLALGQLRVETLLLNRVVEITLMAAGAGLALTLGLGTRDVARHIVAGVYLRDLYRPGMTLVIGEQSGAVQEVGTVVTRLRTPDGGSLFIPNGQLTETTVREAGTASAQPGPTG
jgi:small-conductance mechanosensitive channel